MVFSLKRILFLSETFVILQLLAVKLSFPFSNQRLDVFIASKKLISLQSNVQVGSQVTNGSLRTHLFRNRLIVRRVIPLSLRIGSISQINIFCANWLALSTA